MYLTRTNPMMRDKKAEDMSTTVAEKTECACDGRSMARPRAQRERGEGWVGIASATGVDSTGTRPIAARREPAGAIHARIPREYSVPWGMACGE